MSGTFDRLPRRSLKRSRNDEEESTPQSTSRHSKKPCNHLNMEYPTPGPSEDEDAYNPRPTCKAAESPSGDMQHPRFYFEDGDVTFTTSSYRFKVHTFLLIGNSPFFEDMFEIANPDNSERTDENPVINLDGIETAWNMSVWLAKIYDDQGYFQTLLDDSTLQVVDALYHLGNKYTHPEYCAHAKLLLTSIFPTDLSTWSQSLSSIPLCTAFEAIPLAKHNCPIVLPAAFYVASSASLDDIIQGTTDFSNKRTLTLNPEDQVTVLRGKLRRGQIRRNHTFSVFQDVLQRGESWPDHKCSHKRACSEWLRTVYGRLDGCGFFGNDQDCFEPLNKTLWDYTSKGLCTICRNQVKDGIWVGQQEACAAVPDMFGLHSWLDVKLEQMAVDEFQTE
ncbi:hypothetical protein OE88DRAFT_1723777 [Heliocybe sulcata]|uniref:BTB domain-containing protein n=1 Tax=Heliocybe sulcata TaxID=5364 RepID=A0A5C3N9P9_9AGAM|nr:hypothetical protein OE88DRAFT_1723777 [Heliocybe sulcata]